MFMTIGDPKEYQELVDCHRLYPTTPHPLQVAEAERLDIPLALWHPVTGMVLALIPGTNGQAQGSEKSRRGAFYCCVTPVTASQYKHFRMPQEPNCPVVDVTWTDVKAFCEWTGLRLLRDTEWEHAARGGLEGAKYPWGDEDPVDSPGAVNGARVGLHPVATYGRNGFGLFDMTGNTWEMVEGPSGLQARGGSPRVSHWHPLPEPRASGHLGFRCAWGPWRVRVNPYRCR